MSELTELIQQHRETLAEKEKSVEDAEQYLAAKEAELQRVVAVLATAQGELDDARKALDEGAERNAAARAANRLHGLPAPEPIADHVAQRETVQQLEREFELLEQAELEVRNAVGSASRALDDAKTSRVGFARAASFEQLRYAVRGLYPYLMRAAAMADGAGCDMPDGELFGAHNHYGPLNIHARPVRKNPAGHIKMVFPYRLEEDDWTALRRELWALLRGE